MNLVSDGQLTHNGHFRLLDHSSNSIVNVQILVCPVNLALRTHRTRVSHSLELIIGAYPSSCSVHEPGPSAWETSVVPTRQPALRADSNYWVKFVQMLSLMQKSILKDGKDVTVRCLGSNGWNIFFSYFDRCRWLISQRPKFPIGTQSDLTILIYLRITNVFTK